MFDLEKLCFIINKNFEEFDKNRLKETFEKNKNNNINLRKELYALIKEKDGLIEKYLNKKLTDNNERLIPTPPKEKQEESQKDKLKNRLKIKD